MSYHQKKKHDSMLQNKLFSPEFLQNGKLCVLIEEHIGLRKL